MSVSLSADGKTLASGSSDKIVILWNFDLDNLVRDGCDWLDNFLATHPEVLEELKECQTQALLVKAAPALIVRGEELARNGNVDTAVDKIRKAQTWDSSLKFDPKVKAQEFANKGQAEQLVVKGKILAREGKVKEAIAAYTKAQQLDPKNDQEAFYKFVDRFAADSENRVWHPLPKTPEDFAKTPQLIQEHVNKLESGS